MLNKEHSLTKTNKRAINVLLIEDNPGDAFYISELLATDKENNFNFICEERLSSSIERLSKKKIDVVLLDLALPDSNGLETLKTLHLKNPDVPTVVLTNTQNEKLGLELIKEGAQDYLVKGELNFKRLTRSILYALQRYQSYSPASTYLPTQEQLPLTKREKEILCLIAQGLANKEISSQLYLSTSTVRNHISKIFAKLNIQNRAKAAIIACQHGLVKSNIS